jgi:hypothetical protein
VHNWVESKVSEALASEAVQQSLQQRLEDERKLLEAQVSIAHFRLMRHMQA